MRRQLLPALMMTVAMIVVTGLAYPLVVTAVGQVAFTHRANGSLVSLNGHVVGSSLLGQNFSRAEYFQPRPSAAGNGGYDGLSSAASNLGPSNPELVKTVAVRAVAYRQLNNLGPTDPVPVDAVTASGSGLDPDISVANARIQARRVAQARGMAVDDVMRLCDRHTHDRQWGFLGERVVNVLELNLDLRRQR